ncbi:recombinase family protein, partial [Patescibacteria group bacterium]
MSQLQTYQANHKNLENDQIVKNCLVYARVSTDRQVREGHSLNDQVDRLVKYARDKGWRILEVYKDGGKSGGSTTGRPEFTRMLERCAGDDEVQAVLLEETDRFARDAQDHLAVKSFLKKHKVQLIATQQPNFGDDPVGKFVDLVMAGAN